MTRHKMFRRLCLGACSGAALAAGAPTVAQAQEPAASDDVVIVTGTRIARSAGIPPASPVEVLGASRLEATSVNTLATLLKDLPANFGSSFSSGRGLGGGDRGAGTVNLRGLGAAATLVLLDGQRTTQLPDSQDNVVDVNSLIPQIMIERIEVVKDGASAIYGSDAVAGVVNLITRRNFTGLRIDGRVNHFTYSDRGDRRLELMAGGPIGRGHFVAAASYIDQDHMMLGTDLKILEGEAYDARWSSPTSWPGIFSVPQRDASGALTGARSSMADPDCGRIQGAFPSSGVLIDGVAERLPSAQGATQCRFHFYPEGAAQADIEQFQTFARFDYDVSDRVRFDATMAYTTSKVLTYFTSGGTASFPNLVVPGHNPGNIYRAIDASGNPLYAVSSGVSAGYSRDGAEVFLPARDASGAVILTADPTNPASGIPFHEDVGFTGRGIGSQGGLPTNNTWDQPGYSLSRPSRSDVDLIRAGAGLTGDLFGGWTWQSGANYTRYNLSTNGEVGTALQSQFLNALNGLGGPNCSGSLPGQNGCEYYNVAGNSTFATAPGDPRANSQSVIDYVFPLQNDTFRSSLLVADASLAGEAFNLPAGPVGVALGYQMRRASLAVDYDINKNIRNTATNTVSFDFDESRTTHAVFGEAIVPVFDTSAGYMEISAALRHEESDNFSTTDPKIGFIYNTADRFLTLRGTYGTSFVAPSLFRLFAVSGGGGTINDICADPVCTGTLNQVITSQTQGNPNLQPETAETFSVGGSIRPLDSLTLSLDWWRYDFTNRIATEQPQVVLNADPTGALTGRVIRGSNGQVLQINTQYFNAPSLVTEGFDIAANYVHDLGNAGTLTANLSASYVPVYKFQLQPGAPFENFAGQENQRRSGAAAASPKWRGNLFLGWTRGDHAVNSTIHYTDSLIFNKGGYISPTLNPDHKVESWITVDLSYTYSVRPSLLPIGADRLNLSVGVTNLFDADVPELPVPASQKFIGNLYDLRGRMVWAGVSAAF